MSRRQLYLMQSPWQHCHHRAICLGQSGAENRVAVEGVCQRPSTPRLATAAACPHRQAETGGLSCRLAAPPTASPASSRHTRLHLTWVPGSLQLLAAMDPLLVTAAGTHVPRQQAAGLSCDPESPSGAAGQELAPRHICSLLCGPRATDHTPLAPRILESGSSPLQPSLSSHSPRSHRCWGCSQLECPPPAPHDLHPASVSVCLATPPPMLWVLSF